MGILKHLLGSRNVVSSTGDRVPAEPTPRVEPLEPRRLLSASPAVAGDIPVNPGGPIILPTPVVTQLKSFGVTLHLKAGQSFDGYVGGLSGVQNAASDFRNLNASIDWGDGSASTNGTFVAGPKPGHVNVSGKHTYTADGNFTITISVSEGPLLPPGQPNPFFFIHLADIHSHAVVSEPVNGSGGVTIHEVAGTSFTTPVGSFNFIAPGSGLSAAISWGDGTTSTGKIVAIAGFDVDVIKFNVVGTHDYSAAGKFPIRIIVTHSFGPGTNSAVIATIDSMADVVAR